MYFNLKYVEKSYCVNGTFRFRCLVNYARNDSSMSETLDDEVNYAGLLTSTQFHTLIRIMHGVHMKMIVKTK